VLVYVADEHLALYAGARTLQANVVGLYGVVVILGRWVRVGCARLLYGHEVPPRGPGSGELPLLRGLSFALHLYFNRLLTIINPFANHSWYTTDGK
jgi:hypothetical protein